MDKKIFVSIMTMLGTAYNKELKNEDLTLWYGFFKEYDPDLFNQTIKEIILTEKFMPSIATVNERLLKNKNGNLKIKANDEWELVLDNIRAGKLTTYKFEPITQKVITTMGIDRLKMMETAKREWFRKEFIELFEYEQAKEEYSEIQLQIENKKNCLVNL